MASVEVIGMIPVEVIPEFPDMADGAKYRTGIMRAMFGNVSVAMTSCGISLVGGCKKGVPDMPHGRIDESVVTISVVSIFSSCLGLVFDELIILILTMN